AFKGQFDETGIRARSKTGVLQGYCCSPSGPAATDGPLGSKRPFPSGGGRASRQDSGAFAGARLGSRSQEWEAVSTCRSLSAARIDEKPRNRQDSETCEERSRYPLHRPLAQMARPSLEPAEGPPPSDWAFLRSFQHHRRNARVLCASAGRSRNPDDLVE